MSGADPTTPPPGIRLIDVTLEELDALAVSVRALMQDEGGPAVDPTTLRVELLARLQRGRRAVLFATGTATTAIGHALWRPLADRCRIEQFRIAPHHRRRGLGSACLRALVTERDLSGRPLEVRVLEDNPTAIAFWRAMGFEPVRPDAGGNADADADKLQRSMLVLPRSHRAEGGRPR